jgi:hypothetical protein
MCQPTAKFYGKDGKRHITVLEHERASLPLRLTGDGVGVLYFLSLLFSGLKSAVLAMASQISTLRVPRGDQNCNPEDTE